MMKLSNALLLSLVVQVAVYAQPRPSVYVQDDSRVGLIVTGTGNTLHTTQIFGKSPEYAELKGALNEYAKEIRTKTEQCAEMETDQLPERYIAHCRAELSKLNRKQDSIQKIERKFRQDVLRLAETFSQMSINSERLRIAKSLFDQGRIKEADAVLDTRGMAGETAQLIAQRARLMRSQVETDSLLTLKAKEWLIKAQITEIRYELANWKDSTTYFFQQSIACQASYENLAAYADFFYEQNQLDSSEFYFNRIKQEQYTNLPARAKVSFILGLGNIHQLRGDLELSEVEYQKALQELEHFPKEDSIGALWYRSIIESNLGVLYQAQRKYQASEENQLKSLRALLALSAIDSVSWREDLAATQNNLGTFYKSQSKHELALKYYSTALEIRRELAAESPSVFKHQLGGSLNNVGITLRALRLLDQAYTTLLEAKMIWEELVQQNRDRFLPELARTQQNLGAILLDLRKLDAAAEQFQAAIQGRSTLAEQEPRVFLPQLVKSQNSLGVTYFVSREFQKTTEILERVVQLYQDREEILSSSTDNLEVTLNILGNAYDALGEKEKALQTLEKALVLARKKATAGSFFEKIQLGWTLLVVADARSTNDDTLSAVDAAQEALSYADQFFFHAHAQELFYQITQYVGLGVLNPDLEKAQLAAAPLEASLEETTEIAQKGRLQKQILVIWENALEQSPDSKYLKRFLAINYGDLSNFQLQMGEFKEAEQAARKALQLDDSQQWLTAQVALALFFQDQLTAARVIYIEQKDVLLQGRGYWAQHFRKLLDQVAQNDQVEIDVEDTIKQIAQDGKR